MKNFVILFLFSIYFITVAWFCFLKETYVERDFTPEQQMSEQVKRMYLPFPIMYKTYYEPDYLNCEICCKNKCPADGINLMGIALDIVLVIAVGVVIKKIVKLERNN